MRNICLWFLDELAPLHIHLYVLHITFFTFYKVVTKIVSCQGKMWAGRGSDFWPASQWTRFNTHAVWYKGLLKIWLLGFIFLLFNDVGDVIHLRAVSSSNTGTDRIITSPPSSWTRWTSPAVPRRSESHTRRRQSCPCRIEFLSKRIPVCFALRNEIHISAPLTERFMWVNAH